MHLAQATTLEGFSLDDAQADIRGITEGLYNAQKTNARKKRELFSIKCILGGISEGASLLDLQKSLHMKVKDSHDSLKERILFFKERVRAAESQVELCIEDFGNVNTMVGTNLPMLTTKF